MRIVIFWKDRLIAEALVKLLESEGRFRVVCWSSNARECLAAIRENYANVVIVEGAVLQPGEWELLQGARFLGNFALLLVAQNADAEAVEGVDATIELSQSAHDLFEAARKLSEPFVTVERRGRKPRGAGKGLSFREQEITALVAKGYSNRKIAEMVGLQEQSVKNLVSSIMRRSGCENRTQLALQLAVTNPTA